MPVTQSFNHHFSANDNAKLAQLVKHEPQHNYIRARRSRKSTLDLHLPEILKLRDKGWSYLRITNSLKKQYKFKSLNKSSVMRRVNRFLEKA